MVGNGLCLLSDGSKHDGSLSKSVDDVHYDHQGDEERCDAGCDYDTICDENSMDDSGVKFATYALHNKYINHIIVVSFYSRHNYGLTTFIPSKNYIALRMNRPKFSSSLIFRCMGGSTSDGSLRR